MITSCASVMALPPANDQFISAELLTGLSPTTTGTTVEATATTNSSDETYAGEIGTSGTVWYKWTAPVGAVSVRVTVQFNGALGECMVRTGASASTLVGGMAQYLNPAANWRSFLVRVIPGTEYRIKVANSNGNNVGSSFNLSLLANSGLALPLNDTKSSATVLPSQQNVTTTGSFQNATSDADEGHYTDQASVKFTISPSAVWYRWLAPTTGYHGITVIGEKYLKAHVVKFSDPRSLVYDSVDTLNGFQAVAGVTYYIKVVSEVGGDFYSGAFQLFLAPRPYADRFVSEDPPRPLEQSLNYQLAGSTPSDQNASSAPAFLLGIPNVYCFLTTYPSAVILTPGVWEITGYDPKVVRITVFRESSGTYSPVASNHLSASTHFTVAGTFVYYAEVSLAYPENALSAASLTGTLSLNQISPSCVPANDSFANAVILNSQPLTSIKGSTVGASGEVFEEYSERGEEVSRDIASRSVWYRWTPLASATHYLVALDEENKPLHLRLTSGSLGALSNLGADSELSDAGVEVSAATPCHICVDDQFASSTGNFRLFVGRTLSFDSFANRQLLTKNASGIASWRYGNSLGMTRELEPNIEGIGHTAWFEYRADSATPISINTFGSSYDTVLHVYSGNTLATLTLIATNDDFDLGVNRSSAITFTPVSGTFYQIRVAGYRDQKGIFSLQLGQQPPSWKPYEVWALNYDWSNPERAEMMDPDSDGLTNLQECIFGGHPLIHEKSRSAPTISSPASMPPELLSPPNFGIRYRVVSKNLVGLGIGSPLTLTPQSSVDLVAWQAASGTVESGITTVTAPVPPGGPSKFFLRTQISGR